MTLLARSTPRPAGDAPRRDEAIEPGRLARSLTRAWVKTGPRQYRIAGVHQPWYDVDLDSDTPCYCESARFSGIMCLHELRARTVERDPRVFDAVVALYERRVRQDEEAQRASRAPRPARRRRAAQRASHTTSSAASPTAEG